MKRSTIPKRLLLSGLLATGAGGLALATQANAAHPQPVPLLDVNGGAAAITGLPYSPKATCGTTACHISRAIFHGISNLYEADWALSHKTQYNRDGAAVTSDVPYPQHGVSAGSHFQQGRNISWDATSQAFYKVPEFTSSAGMFGKY